MSHATRIKQILLACEIAKNALAMISPAHQLLRYELKGKSEVDIVDFKNFLFADFAPQGAYLSSLTEKVIRDTYLSYLRSLQTAIVIEKARLGLP